jgi:hypothetical protein
MDTILLYLHSWVRWVVVIVMIAALFYAIYGLTARRDFDKNANLLTRIFGMLFGLQWLLGLILFVLQGQFEVATRIEHAVTMTGALIVAHLYIPFKKRSAITRYGVMIAILLVVSILVYVGVARVGMGWNPRFP